MAAIFEWRIESRCLAYQNQKLHLIFASLLKSLTTWPHLLYTIWTSFVWPIRTNTKLKIISPFVYPNQIATTTIAKSQLRVVFKVHSTHFTTWLGLCSLTLCLSSGRHRNLVVIIIFYTTSNSFKNHWCNRSTLILWQSFQRRDYIKGLQHLTISEVWSVNDKAVSNLLFLEVSSGLLAVSSLTDHMVVSYSP